MLIKKNNNKLNCLEAFLDKKWITKKCRIVNALIKKYI